MLTLGKEIKADHGKRVLARDEKLGSIVRELSMHKWEGMLVA